MDMLVALTQGLRWIGFWSGHSSSRRCGPELGTGLCAVAGPPGAQTSFRNRPSCNTFVTFSSLSLFLKIELKFKRDKILSQVGL
jgi:hypothetical protein